MTLEGQKSSSKGGKTIILEKMNVITIITHFCLFFFFFLGQRNSETVIYFLSQSLTYKNTLPKTVKISNQKILEKRTFSNVLFSSFKSHSSIFN